MKHALAVVIPLVYWYALRYGDLCQTLPVLEAESLAVTDQILVGNPAERMPVDGCYVKLEQHIIMA